MICSYECSVGVLSWYLFGLISLVTLNHLEIFSFVLNLLVVGGLVQNSIVGIETRSLFHTIRMRPCAALFLILSININRTKIKY